MVRQISPRNKSDRREASVSGPSAATCPIVASVFTSRCHRSLVSLCQAAATLDSPQLGDSSTSGALERFDAANHLAVMVGPRRGSRFPAPLAKASNQSDARSGCARFCGYFNAVGHTGRSPQTSRKVPWLACWEVKEATYPVSNGQKRVYPDKESC